MQDLDDITCKLKTKLTCGPSTNQQSTDHTRVSEFDHPSSCDQYPLTSTHSDLTFDLPRSQRETPRDDLTNTGSQGAESMRTGGDSGAYSVEQSNEKYDDSAPVSNRSASDKQDTLRSGVTPRDLLDSGIPYTNNNSNNEDPDQNVWMTVSPRESHEKKDEYSESGGFSFRQTPRDAMITPREHAYSPRDNFHVPNGNSNHSVQEAAKATTKDLEQILNSDLNTHIQQHIDNARKLLSDTKDGRTVDQKQMSIIQEYSENDHSDSEGEENRYYHRYRDLLDTEDQGSDKGEEDEEDAGEVIVPRRINDVSGKFSPTGEIIMLSDDISQTVPYGVRSLGSDKTLEPDSDSDEKVMKHVPNEPTGHNNDDVVLEDMDSDEEDEVADKDGIIFDEKDSWLSDSDKENEDNPPVYNRYLGNHGQMVKHKPQRQDSDTGYSSRDNVSESYLTPSAGGTNSETDISRLHEHEHWSDQRESGEDPVFMDKAKVRLLANVELESTGGSFGLRYDGPRHDSAGPSRISSAGSRHTRKSSEQSVTESFDEKEEQDYLRQELEPIHSARETISSSRETNPPHSARSEELDTFFNSESAQTNIIKERKRSESECSENSGKSGGSHGSHRSGGSNQSLKHMGDRLSPREAANRTIKQPVPNFFMPVQHLEESLRTLQSVTNKVRI